MCIQPDEGIHLKFQAKSPGSNRDMRSVDMEFHYQSAFEGETIPDAYERLLQEATEADASLFTRSDGIEAAWRLIDPIIRGWKDKKSGELTTYDPGSWGPREAQGLLERDGRVWRTGCGGHKNSITLKV